MAKYTIELRKIIDLYSRSEVESWFKDYELNDYLTSEQIATINNANIWSKDKLAKKIVDNYYTREIAFETPALFEMKAKVKMSNIMDKYLPLIYTNSLNYNPLEDINVNASESRTINNTNSKNSSTDKTISNTNSSSLTSNSTSTNTNNGSGLLVNSNTPQGQISKASILNGTYATDTSANENTNTSNITDNSTSSTSGTNDTTDNTTSITNGTNNTTETLTKTNTGNNRSKQELLLEYRKTILNIDEMILKELNDLFFGLW